MKKILILSTLSLSLNVFAQTDTAQQTDSLKIRIVELPDSSAIGTPDGNPVTKDIGPLGGTIVSDDKRIELIFPPDALTVNTTITIQPTGNPAPNGTGKAYRFEPSGTQFKKPVQMIFHYTDDEAKTCPPDLMGFGLQDDQGKWTLIDYEDWDSMGKTLKCFIEHFSGGSNINQLELSPVPNIIRAGGKSTISFLEFSPKSRKNPTKGKNIHLGKFSLDQRVRDFEVNDISSGNEYVGKISEGGLYINDKTRSFMENFIYHAPKSLPDKNPVTITARIFLVDLNGDAITEQKKLSCKIELYDEYKVLVNDTVEVRVGMGTFLVDSGKFVTRLTKDGVVLQNMTDYSPYVWPRFEPPKPFKIKVYTDGCKGRIDVSRPYTIQSIRDKGIPNSPPNVLITFSEQEIPVCKFTEGARGMMTKLESLMTSALPNLVLFKANGTAQTIRTANSRENENLVPYNIYIIPIRD